MLNPEARAAVFEMLERGEKAPLLDPRETALGDPDSADYQDGDIWNEPDEAMSGMSSDQDVQASSRGFPKEFFERGQQANYNSAMKGAVATLAKLG